MSSNLNFCFTKIKSPENHSPHQFNNFNSLYDNSSSDSSSSAASTPDMATVLASRRFFFSSPGRSNSIIDSSSSSIASTSSSSASLGPQPETDSAVAVPTYSPDPFSDFRRSMQEMVEARGVHDVQESWDYLHELLVCYLSLNPKTIHKFIIRAFADLLVALITASPEKFRRKIPSPDGKRKISRQFL